eukprot:425247-Pyramimonas_sp.AAC.1
MVVNTDPKYRNVLRVDICLRVLVDEPEVLVRRQAPAARGHLALQLIHGLAHLEHRLSRDHPHEH